MLLLRRRAPAHRHRASAAEGDPPILILDEATSALDAATEAKVQKVLKALMRGRTTFIIAHRLSTVCEADLILVFRQGRIVERGTFQELVARGGVFADLVHTQLGPAEATKIASAMREAEAELCDPAVSPVRAGNSPAPGE